MRYWKLVGSNPIVYIASERDQSIPHYVQYVEATKEEYDAWKFIKDTRSKADRGLLIDDISVWHTVFSETIIKIILFLPYTELGEKTRLKLISDTIAKYNLDLVIKDFKPDYVVPERDKGVLVTGLKEIEKYNSGIYQRLAMAVGLESTALHNEVVDKYEEIINLIHPKTDTDNQIINSIVGGGT